MSPLRWSTATHTERNGTPFGRYAPENTDKQPAGVRVPFIDPRTMSAWGFVLFLSISFELSLGIALRPYYHALGGYTPPEKT